MVWMGTRSVGLVKGSDRIVTVAGVFGQHGVFKGSGGGGRSWDFDSLGLR